MKQKILVISYSSSYLEAKVYSQKDLSLKLLNTNNLLWRKEKYIQIEKQQSSNVAEDHAFEGESLELTAGVSFPDLDISASSVSWNSLGRG